MKTKNFKKDDLVIIKSRNSADINKVTRVDKVLPLTEMVTVLVLEGKYKRVYKSENLERSEITSIDLNPPVMHLSVQHLLDMLATHLILLNIDPDDDEFKKELHKKVFKVKEMKR